MLKLILPKGYEYNIYDYGTVISFRIYNEDDSTFDGSSFTGYVEVMDEFGNRVVQEIQSSPISNAGLGTFSFTSSALPTASSSQGFTQYYLAIRLEKSGIVLGTERRKILLCPATSTSRLP